MLAVTAAVGAVAKRRIPMISRASRFGIAFAALALLLAASVPSVAQVVANDAYLINYFEYGGPFCANPVSGGIEELRVVNTGQIGSPIDAATKQGTICADIYVFDTNQEMQECCSCPLTANELGLFSLCHGLLSSPLTGVAPIRGVIKMVADQLPANGNCDATTIANPVNGGLRAWFFVRTISGTGAVTASGMNPFLSAPLTANEQQFLGQACAFVLYLGSGKGRCNCPPAPGLEA